MRAIRNIVKNETKSQDLLKQFHLEEIIEDIPIIEFDLEGNIINLNQQALDIIGFAHNFNLQHQTSFFEIISENEQARALLQFQNIITGIPQDPGEYFIQRCDGNDVYIAFYPHPLKNENDIVGVRAYLVDVTDKYLTQTQLLKEKNMFFQIFKHSPVIQAIVLIEDGTFLDINDKFTEILGYSIRDVIGRDIFSLELVRERCVDLKEEYKQFFRDMCINNEIQITTKNGDTIVGLFFSKEIEYLEEKCYLINITDITILKNIEEELRESERKLKDNEAKYRAITENTLIGICLVQEEKIIYLNEGLAEIIGIPQKKLQNKDLGYYLSVIHPDDRSKARKIFTQVTAQEREISQDTFRIITTTGSICWVLSAVKSVFISNKIATVIILLDITKQILAEEQRDQELINKQRLESIGLLAGGIAHDFNNILMSLLGNVQMMEFSESLDEETQQSLKDMETAIFSASNLTRQLLTFSEGGKPVTSIESIEEIVSSNVRLAMRGSKSEFRLKIEPNLDQVKIDKGQISQVIQNLIINANQALLEGGLIKVYVRELDSSEIDRDLEPGKYIAIEVEDNGSGIPKHIQHKIFNPYFTTKSNGHGLGLATSYSIIKKHKGDLFFSSQSGVGTTFTVLLPITNQRKRFLSQNLSIKQKFHGHVLILDDDTKILRTLRKFLETMGFLVVSSVKGQDAIQEYIERLSTENKFDFCIVDLVIPNGLGGLDVAKHILQTDPSAKIIASSGYSNDEVLAEYTKYGFSAVLGKPYTYEMLRKIVMKFVS